MKTTKYLATLFCSLSLGLGVTSCSDFFDVDSNHIIDASTDHLNNATDTIYSVTGILKKMQVIADRTVLLGEARGDLVSITDATPKDLREIADFNISDDNKYNNPADYYAIINNCNYFIANADTSITNNRDEYPVFMKEYAAVKAIRAWTYLQLVTTYGKVPFFTEPLLTNEEAEKMESNQKGIDEICNYFIDEDGLLELADVELPGYGEIKSLNSKLFFVPIRVVLGDLCLWSGRYTEAAHYYHDFLNNSKDGSKTINPIGDYSVKWRNTSWLMPSDGWSTTFCYKSAETSTNSKNEVISLIPTDSIPSEGQFSEIRGFYNTIYAENNNYQVSLVPSNKLINLSAAQTYLYNNEGVLSEAPKGLENYQSGDLRLYATTEGNSTYVTINGGKRIDYYMNNKFYQTRNVHIYRKTLVYLRLAEAMNLAGYPHYAYQILATGVNSNIIKDYVLPYYSQADSVEIMNNFDFVCSELGGSVNNYYEIQVDPEKATLYQINTIGIHQRGCGFTPCDSAYWQRAKLDPTLPEFEGKSKEEILKIQQKAVSDMIMDEEALEFAFEGFRYYDLLREARRREATEPDYLEKIIGSKATKNNWYLKWNGKIGM